MLRLLKLSIAKRAERIRDVSALLGLCPALSHWTLADVAHRAPSSCIAETISVCAATSSVRLPACLFPQSASFCLLAASARAGQTLSPGRDLLRSPCRPAEFSSLPDHPLPQPQQGLETTLKSVPCWKDSGLSFLCFAHRAQDFGHKIQSFRNCCVVSWTCVGRYTFSKCRRWPPQRNVQWHALPFTACLSEPHPIRSLRHLCIAQEALPPLVTVGPQPPAGGSAVQTRVRPSASHGQLSSPRLPHQDTAKIAVLPCREF
jgi:hypothetical protein